MPSGRAASATSRTWATSASRHAAAVSRGAPENPNCPPGSIVIPLPVPFEPDDVRVLARGGETTTLQTRQHGLDSVPAHVGTGTPSTRAPSFSCSIPTLNCWRGFAPTQRSNT